MTYIITEPAPSTTSYIRSGRGGAGNIRTSTTPQPSTTHRVPSNPAPSTRRFFSGVGGAGNAHEASERPALSLDDEVRRLAACEQNASQRGHCGIGGAGNVYSRRKASDASVESDSRSSISSTSSKSKLWARMTGKEY